jgi:diguanylate cyclase (GGDEF)-like protein
LPEVDKQSAVHVLNRLRRDIEKHEIEITEGEKIRVTISFGVSNFQEDEVLPDDFLVKADERLYRVKREGKNRVVFESEVSVS